MNKLVKILTALSLAALMCGVVACGCDKAAETTTEPELTLPVDYFDEDSEADNLRAIKEDIDIIEELQAEGVDTEEKQVRYDLAVEDLLEREPQYKEEIDAGREKHDIDTDALREKYEEASEAYESESASIEAEASSVVAEIESATDSAGNYTLPVETDENGEKQVIELPTVKIN